MSPQTKPLHLKIEFLESDTPVHSRTPAREARCWSLRSSAVPRLDRLRRRTTLLTSPVWYHSKHEAGVVAGALLNLDRHSADFCCGSGWVELEPELGTTLSRGCLHEGGGEYTDMHTQKCIQDRRHAFTFIKYGSNVLCIACSTNQEYDDLIFVGT